MTTNEILSKEYNVIRNTKYSKERTIRLNNLYERMKVTVKNGYIPIFNGNNYNDGNCLLYLVYLENKIVQDESDINLGYLIDIYCKTKHTYILNISINILEKIFNLPCKFFLEENIIIEIYKKFKKDFPIRKNNKKYYKFCETLYKFFDAYPIVLKHLNENEVKMIDKLFEASLLGQAVGDALGFMVEGQPRKVCEKYVKDVIETKKYDNYGVNKNFGYYGSRYTSIEDSENWAFKFGQYTDDTQLCRELIKNIAKNNGNFESSDFSNRLINLMFKSNLLRKGTEIINEIDDIKSGIVGYGKTTLKTVQCLSDGIPWEKAGNLFKSQGNGSCMRTAPLGVLFYENPLKLSETLYKQSLGTHGSSRCLASCILVSEASRLACESKIHPWSFHIIKKPKIFCNRLRDKIENIDKEFSKTLKCIPKWLKEKDEENLVCKITKKGDELGDSLWNNGKVISASAVQTVLFAITCFLKYPNSYENSVEMAIRAGGDTDTVAAICGAICGARTGKYLNCNINDRGYWNNEDLKNLAKEIRIIIKK